MRIKFRSTSKCESTAAGDLRTTAAAASVCSGGEGGAGGDGGRPPINLSLSRPGGRVSKHAAVRSFE